MSSSKFVLVDVSDAADNAKNSCVRDAVIFHLVARVRRYEWIKHAVSRSLAQALVGKLAEIRRVLAIFKIV